MDSQMSDNGRSRSYPSSDENRTQIAPSLLSRRGAKPLKLWSTTSLLASEDSAAWQQQSKRQNLRSLLRCSDSCPACPLRGCNSLASRRRNGSLFAWKYIDEN